MNRHFILATAGHVDHGKSSLVEALTGVDPDRLPEEMARGMTIDLGFASLDLPVASELPSPTPPPDRSTEGPGTSLSGERKTGAVIRLGIVDVPGHEDFVKNMVAGIGPADIALLVVAGDDGWMPQTEEHLQILSYLAVPRLVVALTKVDLPNADEAAVRDNIRQELQDTPFATAPIVPVSSVTRSGLAELKAALAALLSQGPPPADFGKPRLAVDRAFTLRGIGSVVTGTLTGGTFTLGQEVVVQPSGLPARVRSIQSHNQSLTSAGPGMRAALNLADVAVSGGGPGRDRECGIRRGDVVTLRECGEPTTSFDVLLTRSARLGRAKIVPPKLRDGTQVRLHHGTGNWPASLLWLDGTEPQPGKSAVAQLRLESPVFAFVHDRFILRDASGQFTLAGGMVLAEHAGRRNFRGVARRDFLGSCASGINDAAGAASAHLRYSGFVRRSELLVRSHFSAAELGAAVDLLIQQGKAVAVGGLIADAQKWAALRESAVVAIEAFHQTHPERAGLALSELRLALGSRLLYPEVFDGLLSDLAQRGFMHAGTVIKRKTHQQALPPELEAAGARLRAALRLKCFDPPSRRELASEPSAQAALRFLIETGEVVELDSETVVSQQALARATDTIRAFLLARGAATVSQLRQALGTSRRIMVPLLERLDRGGVTLRQGDQRILRAAQKAPLMRPGI